MRADVNWQHRRVQLKWGRAYRVSGINEASLGNKGSVKFTAGTIQAAFVRKGTNLGYLSEYMLKVGSASKEPMGRGILQWSEAVSS